MTVLLLDERERPAPRPTAEVRNVDVRSESTLDLHVDQGHLVRIENRHPALRRRRELDFSACTGGAGLEHDLVVAAARTAGVETRTEAHVRDTFGSDANERAKLAVGNPSVAVEIRRAGETGADAVREDTALDPGPLVHLGVGARRNERPDVRESRRHRALDLFRRRELGPTGLSSDEHVDRVAGVEQDMGTRGGDPSKQGLEVLTKEAAVLELEEPAAVLDVAVTGEDEREHDPFAALLGGVRLRSGPRHRCIEG